MPDVPPSSTRPLQAGALGALFLAGCSAAGPARAYGGSGNLRATDAGSGNPRCAGVDAAGALLSASAAPPRQRLWNPAPEGETHPETSIIWAAAARRYDDLIAASKAKGVPQLDIEAYKKQQGLGGKEEPKRLVCSTGREKACQ